MNHSIDPVFLLEQFKAHVPPLQFYYFETLDSTNRFLKELATLPPETWLCCIANEQTAGRGRFGKTWVSPQDVNIYCSVSFQLPECHPPLAGLSLVTSLSVLKTLASHMPTEHLCIKWPNDVLYQHHKLCGILIERNLNGLIIGMGINVNGVCHNPDHATRPWGSMSQFSGRCHDRNRLIVQLLKQLTQDTQRFFTRGLSDFMQDWEKVDYLKNQKISLLIQDKETVGMARGITETGALIFEDLQGETHYLTSGNASLLSFVRDDD